MFMLVGVASHVSAALIIGSDGQLNGATNINVNGKLYNVEFIDGSCFDLFEGCDEPSDFSFNTPDNADAATLALLQQVFANPLVSFQPTIVRGCESTAQCNVLTPFEVGNASAIVDSSYLNITPNFQSLSGYSSLRAADNTLVIASATYARWKSVPVSEPSTVLIWGLGLIALVSRRFKKQA